MVSMCCVVTGYCNVPSNYWRNNRLNNNKKGERESEEGLY